MAIRTEPVNHWSIDCRKCKHFKNWGKYSCKKCAWYYTSEFKSVIPTKRQLRRQMRKESPQELVKIYDWLRENVFPRNYILPSSCIVFRWSKRKGWFSYCDKKERLIQIGLVYKEGGYELCNRYELYKTMLHEMLHLRMPHHRKSFRKKEQELLKVLKQKKNQIV